MNRLLYIFIALFLYALAVDVSFARLEHGDVDYYLSGVDPNSVVFLTEPGTRATRPKLFSDGNRAFNVALLGNATLRVIPYVLGPPPTAACSMGVFVDDGCQSAPAPLTASFARTNVFTAGGYMNTTAGTTANYMATNCGPSGTSLCRQPFNVAGNGDDGYHIGYYSTSVQMASAAYDPANIGNPTSPYFVTGCKYITGDGVNAGTGGPGTGTTPTTTGGGQLECDKDVNNGNWGGTLQHVNFGPTGGHHCTNFFTAANAIGNTLLDDFYFQNDAGNCGTLNQAFRLAMTNVTGTMTISNFEMDGGSQNFTDVAGSASCVAANSGSGIPCNPTLALSIGVWPTIIKYGAIYNFAYAEVSPNFGSLTMEYDWIEGWTWRGPTNHGEWLQAAGGDAVTQNEIFDHITIVGNKNQSQFSPGGALISTNYGIEVPQLTFNDLTVISPFIGGISAATTTVSGCLGMSPSGGTATTPTCTAGSGPIFYQTSTTLNVVGQGVIINNNCSGSAGGVIYKYIPGPYATTTPPIQGEWYIDNFTTPGATDTEEYAQGTLQGGGGSFTIASAACSGTSVIASAGNVAFFTNGPGHGPNPVGTLTMTGVLSDFSSQANQGYWSFVGGTTQAFFTAINGTAMLAVSNVNVTNGQYVYSPSISACTSSLLNCPTVTSATGSYPLGTPTGVTISGSAINFGPATVSLYTPVTITAGTITSIAPTTLTTGAQQVTVAVGDVIYDVINGTCTGAAPGTCPTVATACTNCTSIAINNPNNVVETAVTMTKLHLTSSPSSTINNAAPGAIAAGNILLGTTSSSTIHFGGTIGPFIAVPSSTAPCNYPTNNILTCPQVVSPTGAGATSYVLNASAGTVGSTNSFVAANSHSPVWCTNPSVVSGNFDMANLISPSILNTVTDSNNSHDQVGC